MSSAPFLPPRQLLLLVSGASAASHCKAAADKPIAIATTLAYRPKDPGGHGSLERIAHYVKGAQRLSASLDAVGSLADRVAITAYLPETYLASLHGSGWCVRDFSERHNGTHLLGVDMLRIYRPLYNYSQALSQRRPWTQRTQRRTDGAATYYKFLAWTFTAYCRVLHVDCDAYFVELPDRYLLHRAPYFAAGPEIAHRKFTGLNTHIMTLTPDFNVYNMLVDKAASGMYLTYTNTEQDVLETIFTASSAGATHRFPRNVHSHNLSRPLPSPLRTPDGANTGIRQADARMGQHACHHISEHVVTLGL